jgi:hypothetical protein
VEHQLPENVVSPDFQILQQQGRPDGSMYCPRRTAGMGVNSCPAASFTDSQLAQHISSETFQQYLTVKMKVGEQRVYEILAHFVRYYLHF